VILKPQSRGESFLYCKQEEGKEEKDENEEK
jgi:hypothetical protein